ncbi:MAG: class I SAM-dependent methyltransferase [Bacteroidota bacterium]
MKLYLKTKDFSVSQEEFELHLDENTELLYTYPLPKDLDPYYDSDNYISHTDANRTLLERLYQIAKFFNLKRKEKYARNYCLDKRTILDIGAGTGDFLAYTRKRKWQVFGIEPNKGAREKARSKGINVHAKMEDLGGNTFQIITLWHVLEHLPNLDESIARIYDLLEAQGTVFVAVPNFKSFDAKYYEKHWAAYDVPRHVWHFSKNAIQQKFKSHGFTLIKTFPIWLDAFYVAILSEKYKGSQWPMLKGMCFGLISNMKALVSKQWSSHIYVLQKG